MKQLRLATLLFFISVLPSVAQITTVFSDDFTTSAGTTYTTTNGFIGSNTRWSMQRSGTDFGAGINGGRMVLSNDASGLSNNTGWVLAYTGTSNFTAPYNSILASNPGQVSWTFNMKQPRSNPSGLISGSYGNAFVLAGTANTTATTGNGYAVVLGNSGKTDPLRLIRYTAGLRTSTNIISSNTTGLNDFGNPYLSVRVTYTPTTGIWQLYVRNDGYTAFQDPASGTLTLQGSVVNTSYTAQSLPLIGAFWNADNRNNQVAYFDNIQVSVATPYITSLSPSSKVANTGAFTLTVNGTNFASNSVVKWNGSNRTTTYVSPTQLNVSIPATDITAAGTASITVTTGTAVSNAVNFIIDPPATPSISASTTAVAGVTTVTGTASASQSFTVSGANLTDDVTVTAPANFEVSTNNTTFTDAIVLPRTNTTLTGQPVTVYVRVKSSAAPAFYSANITLSTTGATSKTVALSATVLAAEPTSSASGITFTNVISSGFTINWTGVGANHLVVVRQGSAVTATPVDGTGYTASTAFGQGSDLGSASYVVYNGTNTSVTISGLSPATTYYVAVYEFNGSGGTQNYRITSPATGNRTTINAPLGLQIYTANAVNTINFDTTVDGVNTGVFDGAGVNPVAADGELSSNAWAFTGFSGGNIAFGGASVEDSSYEHGFSTGGETAGGVYGFEVSGNNLALGIQPATGEFAPGTVTLRFQNQTGAAVTSLSIGYKVYVYNDQAGSSNFNFSHSANNSTYTAVTALDQVTPAAADAIPGWKAYYKVITLTGLNIASNAYYYIRWSGATVSGTVFDEIALDDVVIVANPTTNFAAFSGAAETFTVAGNANLSGDVSVANNISFLNNSWLSIGANTLTLNGTVTNTTAGGLRGGATSNLTVGGTTAKTLSFDQTTAGTTNLFNDFRVATTGGITTTFGNSAAVNGMLTVDEGQTLNLGTNTLTGTLTTITNNGTVITQNTSTTPFTAGRTWSGTGTVTFNGSATQSLVAGTYNNIIINNTNGAVMTGNATVNGTLHIPVANPTATRGGLDTATYTVFMGPNAINTGVADVSGITTRNTGITPNVYYTFGHHHTSIIFPNVGTLPTSLSLKLVLGVAPAGKTDGILRTYNFIQTGGSGTKAIIKSHYLDSELNGNTENRLVDWVVQVNPFPALIEQSRTNYNTTENFVELANVNVSAFSSNFGDMLLTMANSQVATVVWNGSVSNSWTTAANWTPNATPSDATNVIIPNAATTPNDPILNPSVTIGTLSIEQGGILNAPDDSQFTITGANGAWINNGTYNPGAGTSTVTFTANATSTGDATIAGNTTFNNITVPSGTTLRVLTDNYMRITGTFTKAGSFIAGGVHNTVEYAGTGQTVIIPNGVGSAYHNIIFSGTGAVVPTALTVRGNIITNSVVNFAGTTVTLAGTSEDDEVIGGTVAPVFNNLIINKVPGDVHLETDVTVSGVLTLQAGRIDIDNYNLTLGTAAVAGTFSTTTMIVADGTGVVRRPYAGTGSYFFPIGEETSNTAYSPLTVNITSGTFNNAYVSVNVVDAKHPNNNSTASYLTRYWNVTQTGITNAVATITGTYITGDAVGGEATLAAAQLNGAFNVVTNPWIKYGVLSGNTLTVTGATLTPGQTSVISAITAQTLSVTITGEGDFCQNDTVVLTAQVTAGDPPYTYEWSNALGSASTATPPTSVQGTTVYTVTVRDVNGVVSTDTANVTVSPAPVAGTLSGNQIACSGSLPADITLSGYSGTILRWERSTTPGWTNPTVINNTTSVLTGAQIGPVTATRYYRAVIQSGSCPLVYTQAVIISTASTTWNGSSWSNGSPTSTTGIVFSGDYTATADIDGCSIQVINGANVVIPSGTNVTLNGALTVTSGTFTLKNNANLLQLTNVANSGNIIVERDGSALYRQDYTMWSSPVSGTQTLQEFSPETMSNRFYTYNTSTNLFTAVSAAGTFTRAQGYLIRMPNTSTTIAGYNTGAATMTFKGIFDGVPNNGNVSRFLSTVSSGYNLIGNPYPSPISIPAFLAGNTNAIDGTIWVWRKKNNANSINSAYVTINSTGQYVSNGEPEQEDPSGILRTGQGFIVRVKSGNTTNIVAFNNSMRVNDLSNQFFRMSSENSLPESHGIWLNLTGTNGFFSQMYTGYIEGATQGEDYGIDSRYINDSHTVLASVINDAEMIIQGRPLPFNPADTIPLVFKTNTAGNYTIAIDHVDGLFTGNQAIYLKDNLTGVVQDLKEAAYTFATETGTFNTRFEIMYINNVLGSHVPAITANEVIVYKQDKTLNIISGTAVIDDVAIFDTRGRVIYNMNNVNTSSFTVEGLQAEEQVVIIEITTDKGKVSKKVIY